MRRIAAAAVCFAALAPVAQAGAGQPTAIKWLDSFDRALKVACQENKPVFIDWTTPWCGWCKKLERDTFSKPEIIELAQKFVCVRLDGDREEELVRKFRVRGYPTGLFLAPDGTELFRQVGYAGPREYAAVMKHALQLFADYQRAWELRESTKPEDMAFVGHVLLATGQRDEAGQLLEKAAKAGASGPDLQLDLALLVGNPADRLKAIRRWLNENPGHARAAEAYFELAYTAAMERMWQDAYNYFRRAAEAGPDTVWGIRAARYADYIKRKYLQSDCST